MVLLASSYDQSRFLKAADLQREKKFRIKNATEELIGAEQKEKKLVVWFTNDEHGLVLNKTNNRTIRGAFVVREPNDKLLFLLLSPDQFFGHAFDAELLLTIEISRL